jgi:hypothetical protein
MEQRLGGGASGTIFVNLRNSLVNFLPWAAGLPLFWRRGTLSRLAPRDRLLVEGARWPIVLCAFALMLIPGMLPRYTLPLVIPYTLLLALLLKGEMKEGVLRWPLAAGCVVGAGWVVYGIFFAQRVEAHGYARDFAAKINAVMPAGSPIYIFSPSVQPEVFYIHGKLLYPDGAKVLPDNVPWLLAPEGSLKMLRTKFRQSEIRADLREESGREFALLSLEGHIGRRR